MPVSNLQESVYQKIFTRTFGGTVEPAVADLFISGYGFSGLTSFQKNYLVILE